MSPRLGWWIAALLVLLSSPLPAQDSWTVRGTDAGAEKVVQGHLDGDWHMPPVPDDGSCRQDEPVVRDRSQEFILEFTLGEDAPSRFRVAFETPDAQHEWCVLELQFDPLSGGDWRFTARTPDGSSMVVPLEEPPEPEGLRYRLRWFLPAEGGHVLELEGRPVVVTPIGRWESGHLTLTRHGSVQRVRLQGPAPRADGLAADLVRQSRAAPTEPGGWWRALLASDRGPTDPGPLPDPSAVGAMPIRDVGPLNLGEVILERIVLEAQPRLDIPALLIRPAGSDEPGPGVLWLCDRPAGKADAKVVAAAMAVARQGVVSLIPDLIARGERREFQSHDGPHHMGTWIWGPSFLELSAAEARRWIATLNGREETESVRMVVGLGAASRTATRLASMDPTLTSVVDDRFPDLKALATQPPVPGKLPRVSLAHRDVGPALPHDHSRSTQELGTRIIQVSDENGVTTSIQTVLGLPAIDPTPLPPPSRDQLLLGHLEIGSLWYSWILDETLRSADGTVPGESGDRIEALRSAVGFEVGDPARSVASGGNGVQVIETDRGARAHVLTVHESDTTRGVDGWPDATTQHVTLALGDLGKIQALEQARRTLPARANEVWIGVDPRGTGAEALGLYEHALVSASIGRPIAGQWASDLHAIQRRVHELAPDARIRLFGEGAGALAVLLTAAFDGDGITSVTGLHAVPSFRTLIQGDPRFWTWRSPREEFTVNPSAAWFIPGVAAITEIEDLALTLMDRSIHVEWLEPVDRFRQPLNRRDRHAMWPRVRHRQWVQER